MNHFRCLLIFLMSIFSSFSIASNIIYFPYKISSSVGAVVANGNYIDLRADLDSDGKLDYWALRKENVWIEQFFKDGQVSELKIEQVLRNSIREIVYSREGHKLVLQKAVDRLPRTFGFSNILFTDKKLDVCEAQKNIFSELSKLGDNFESDVSIENLDKKGIIDSSCNGENAVINKAQYRNLVLSLASSLDISRNNFLKCLEDSNTSTILGKNLDAKQREQMGQELKLIALKYKLYAAQFYKNPESLKAKILCKKSPTKGVAAQTVEKKNLIFYSQDESYRKVTTHEILHDIGITGEKTTNAIIEVCVEKKKSLPKSALDGIGKSTFATLGNVKVASNEQAKKAPVKIPKEIAETAIQNPPVAQLNQPFVESKQAVIEEARAPEAAATRALGRSMSQTSGVFSTANTLLSTFGGSAVPAAFAAGTASGIGVGGGGGSVRGPASTSGTTRTKSLRKNDDDEYHVEEEILVSDPASKLAAQSRSAPRGSQDDSNPETGRASARAGANSLGAAANIPAPSFGGGGGSETGGGSAGTTGGGGRIRSSGGGSGGGSRSGGSRNPASVQGRGSSPAANSIVSLNRQDLIGAFKAKASYNDIKKQLTRDDVQRKLRTNSISVMDTEGNVIGAPRGQTIFLDSGDAFVQQK